MNWRWPVFVAAVAVPVWAATTCAFMVDEALPIPIAALAALGIMAASVIFALLIISGMNWVMRGDRR